MSDFAKLRFGQTSAVVSSTQQSIEDFGASAVVFLNEPIFVYQEKAVSIISIIKFFSIFIVGFLLANILKNKINKLYHVANFSPTKLIANLGFYLLIFLAFIIALQSIGLDLSSLSLIAGALSIGIGFGFQSAVSNLAAGIIIMIEKSVSIGDFIEITEDLHGTVHNIGMRSTTIRTEDNLDIIVPNSTFIKSSFVNRTLEDDIRQIHIPFSMQIGTKIKDVEKSILKALNDSDLTYLNQKDKEPSICMIDLDENSIKFELLVWIYNCTLKHPKAKKSDFLKLIYSAI